MTVPQHTDTTPRPPRFALTERLAVAVEVNDDRGLPVHATTGWLVNISQNGAQLAVPRELPLSGSLRLKITLTTLGMTFYVGGSVCWTSPSPSAPGEWVIGCSLGPGIPERILSRMVTGGMLERRASARTEEPLLTNLIIDDTQELAAAVQNFSDGGFCLQAETQLSPGQKVRLQLPQVSDSIRTVEGVVQWSIAFNGSCLMGCSLSA
jgi:hypothetical protein